MVGDGLVEGILPVPTAGDSTGHEEVDVVGELFAVDGVWCETVSLVTMASPSSLTAASHVLLMWSPTAIMMLAAALVARAPASAMNANGHARASAAAVESSLRLRAVLARAAA